MWSWPALLKTGTTLESEDMEMLNRAVDGAALFKDMMQKVEAGAALALAGLTHDEVLEAGGTDAIRKDGTT